MQPQNIVIRMPNWVGDLVMATPILADVKKVFPGAFLTAMCRRPLCDLLQEDPSIDELFCFEKWTSRFSRGDAHRNIIAKLQAGHFDVGILLTQSFSSAWWFWQGNVKRRIGFAGHFRRWLLTDALPSPKTLFHQVDQWKKLLEPLGIPPSNTKPRLYLDKKEILTSKELLYQRGYVRGKKLIGIHPGAAYGSAKCWLPERFQELALKLASPDHYVIFFGDAAASGLIKKICQDLPEQVLDLAGMTNLRELACLIHDCDVLITNDSGPMHIADAFGVPLVALFGSTEEALTGPYNQPHSVIHKRIPCSPCFKRECPIDFRCMKEISVEEVEQKVRKILV